MNWSKTIVFLYCLGSITSLAYSKSKLNSTQVQNWVYHPVFPFCWAPLLASTYIFMYNYYNYSQTLCIKCWVSAFHIEINKISLFFWLPLKEGVKAGPKTGWRQGDFTDNSIIMNVNFTLVLSFYISIWFKQVPCKKNKDTATNLVDASYA